MCLRENRGILPLPDADVQPYRQAVGLQAPLFPISLRQSIVEVLPEPDVNLDEMPSIWIETE
jgi:hypothetical protein